MSRRSGSPRVWIGHGEGALFQEVKDSALTNPDPTWLPDGRLAWPIPDARNYAIRDLKTGRQEFLVKNPSVGWIFDPRFSPAGDVVAVLWNRQKGGVGEPGLWLVSWPDRQERLLVPRETVPIGWSADGKWIYVASSGGTVSRVSASSGRMEDIGRFSMGNLQNDQCALLPNRAAIICAIIDQKSDAWVIQHFDQIR
jgi:Tol biopolymer transport system component